VNQITVGAESWRRPVVRGFLGRNENKVYKMGTISVLLADDHAVVRQGLRMLLQTEPGIEIVGEAENGEQAVALAEQLRPTIVLMDVAMPILNGAQASRQIRRVSPATQIVVLSSYADDHVVDQLLEAGAGGYLVKWAAATEVIKAIRDVSAGTQYFSAEIAKRLSHRRQLASQRKRRSSSPSRLSKRESEVLQLIAEGFSNKLMAAELGISIKTVEKHRQRVMQKLALHETASLTRYAISHGMLEKPRPSADAIPEPALETP
jgi:DNA-binding NarL/FixJ family response regulator